MNIFRTWPFGDNRFWRLQRHVWRDREQVEHVTESLVPPGYSVRHDTGVTARYAVPEKMTGKFSCDNQNGYCIHVTDETGQSVAHIPLFRDPDLLVSGTSQGLPLEKALWVAKTITDALNKAQHEPVPKWDDCQECEETKES